MKNWLHFKTTQEAGAIVFVSFLRLLGNENSGHVNFGYSNDATVNYRNEGKGERARGRPRTTRSK